MNYTVERTRKGSNYSLVQFSCHLVMGGTSASLSRKAAACLGT
jgi:hypothetical protein